ncbi:MAG: DNA/RNA helicase domain-containing protein [Candidatus Saccharimonadales bacterium]
MNDANIKTYNFSSLGIDTLGLEDKETNWPVVYQIYDHSSIYIGETTNLKSRMLQHSKNEKKVQLNRFSVIFNETYNKSVALDLESQLIQWFSGDGKFTMLNKNDGIADREYYNRQEYRKHFEDTWGQLLRLGIAHKTIPEIENSGLFKFSPYKRLNESQIDAVNNVLTDLDEAFKYNQKSISVIGGSEGTGKTILIMYLVKLIRDLQDHNPTTHEEEVTDQSFDLFFKEPFNNRFKNKSLALVIPSPSLKGSISKIFKGIANMQNSVDVLSPIEFGSNGKTYDITFVDEAHLLKASNQEVHKANRERVDEINNTLFNDTAAHTEIDWIIKKSRNVVMVFGDQRVRPNHITMQDIGRYQFREHILRSQMRSKGGELYIDYLREIMNNRPPEKKQYFENFEFKLYEDFAKFVAAIKDKNSEVGLSRLVAGFAWDWKSKRDKNYYDIKINGINLKWNSTLSDWVGSPNSVNEVGSIYTIQGYDLNYCGVIVGNDIKYDPATRKIILNRQNYFDRGAKKRNKQQLESNIKLTDDELLDQVLRTYRILMNRSIQGTYVYVCDPNLRQYLRQFIEVIT